MYLDVDICIWLWPHNNNPSLWLLSCDATNCWCRKLDIKRKGKRSIKKRRDTKNFCDKNKLASKGCFYSIFHFYFCGVSIERRSWYMTWQGYGHYRHGYARSHSHTHVRGCEHKILKTCKLNECEKMKRLSCSHVLFVCLFSRLLLSMSMLMSLLIFMFIFELHLSYCIFKNDSNINVNAYCLLLFIWSQLHSSRHCRLFFSLNTNSNSISFSFEFINSRMREMKVKFYWTQNSGVQW